MVILRPTLLTYKVTVVGPVNLDAITAAWAAGADSEFPLAAAETPLVVSVTGDCNEVAEVDGPTLFGDQLIAQYCDNLPADKVAAVKAPLDRRAAP